MITVTILTKNSQKYLVEVLDALQLFDEVLLYDNGSSDKTFEIASHYSNVVVYHGPFEGFGVMHNKATELARNDWILSIDSDEVVTPEMALEILNAQLSPDCVYSFPRHNFYNNRHIKCCGWYPDRQNRLYYRKKTAFTNAEVHESIITDRLTIVKFCGAIKHYSYETTADFLKKMQVYSDLFAKQYKGKRKSSIMTAVGHATFTFFKNYFFQRGILYGKEGFIVSIYNANTAFYKYLKLLEANGEM